MRILITGSREDMVPWEWLHRDWSWLLQQCAARSEGLWLVHGACPTGVDEEVNRFKEMMSDRWWSSRPSSDLFPLFPLGIERHPAGAPFWEFGPWPAAGPKRNAHMVSLGADLCLAYPLGESKGTRGCAKLAIGAGIPTLITEYPPFVDPMPFPERLARYMPGLNLWEK